MEALALSTSSERELAQLRGFSWLKNAVHEIMTRHAPDKERIPPQSIMTIDEICQKVIDQVMADPNTNIREMLELISGRDNRLQRPMTREEKNILAQLTYAIQNKIEDYGALKGAKNPLGVRRVRAISDPAH